MKKAIFCLFFLIVFLCSSHSFAFEKPHIPTQFLEVPNLEEELRKNDVMFILSIDGGGIRGIIPIYLLRYLERKTNKMSADLFQMFAGTSTGAIIVVGLTMPKTEGAPELSADTLFTYYNTDGNKIFYAPWWYQVLTLNGMVGTKFLSTYKDKFIRELGGKVKLSQLRSDVFIPTFSLLYRVPHFFTTWEAREDSDNDYYITDILNGATAPVTIFSPRDLNNINENAHDVIMDGGFVCNNPSLNAYLNARLLYPQKKIVLVSLGVGRRLPYLSPEVVEHEIKEWGIIQAARTVFILTLDGVAENTNRELTQIFHQKSSPLLAYYRFNIHIDKEHQDPFNGSKRNIEALDHYGKKLVDQNRKILNRLADLLKKYSH